MTFDEALVQLRRLPAIPAVVQEMMATFDRADVSIDDIARQLERDQVLTARVLRVANSSFYGYSRKIASMHDAVVVMGLAGVRSLVLSAGLLHAFDRNDGGTLDRREYWKRCFRVASYAKAVAKCLRQSPEVAFTAGMLHDIGRLAMDTCFPEQYAQAVATAGEEGDLTAAEEAILGFHHGALGAEVARRWNFPPLIEQAIRDCHSPGMVFHGPISAAVCMAIRIDRGDSLEAVVDGIPLALRQDLGLDAAKLAAALPDRMQLESGVASLVA